MADDTQAQIDQVLSDLRATVARISDGARALEERRALIGRARELGIAGREVEAAAEVTEHGRRLIEKDLGHGPRPRGGFRTSRADDKS